MQTEIYCTGIHKKYCLEPYIPPFKTSVAWASRMELVTVLSSNLFDLDEYIRIYLLEHPDISFGTAIKIILRYYTTPELILQLTEFKNHLKTVNFWLFQEVFGKKRLDNS